jgi:hypothetical protein
MKRAATSSRDTNPRGPWPRWACASACALSSGSTGRSWLCARVASRNCSVSRPAIWTWRRLAVDGAGEKVAQERARACSVIARPGRFELPTPGSVDQCSIQLSYGRLPSTGERTILGAGPLSKGSREASQTLQGPRATVTRAPFLDSASAAPITKNIVYYVLLHRSPARSFRVARALLCSTSSHRRGLRRTEGS